MGTTFWQLFSCKDPPIGIGFSPSLRSLISSEADPRLIGSITEPLRAYAIPSGDSGFKLKDDLTALADCLSVRNNYEAISAPTASDYVSKRLRPRFGMA